VIFTPWISDVDGAAERPTAVDDDRVGQQSDPLGRLATILYERVHVNHLTA
jgi:hypothetical protein